MGKGTKLMLLLGGAGTITVFGYWLYRKLFVPFERVDIDPEASHCSISGQV